MAKQSWVSVARVIRPQGRRGEVLAEVLTDFPERFAAMRNSFLQRRKSLPPEPILLEQSWLHKGKVVLKFAGVDSISAAEVLRGAEVVIPAAERVALDPDAVYVSDLIGCQLVDMHPADAPVPERAQSVGTVREVIQQAESADLLVVAGADGHEYEIPFAKAYLLRIDLAERRLEMNLPPGLLEVNAPLNEEERRARQGASESQP
ncbi:MAG: ribosome maturation factor RimM [Terriglobia bacterium]|nr:ribosome maturation factor RimM [Terriglobia bacterium]